MCVLGVFLTAAGVQAQGTISDGPVAFSVGNSAFDSSPNADLIGVVLPLAQDQLFEAGWFYRVSGDSRETPFPAPTTQNYTGAVATLTWSDVDGRGFSAQRVISVTDVGGPSGMFTDTMSVTNQTGGSLGVTLFHMIDPDLSGSPTNDSGLLLVANDHMRLSDATAFLEYLGVGAASFLVRPFGGTDIGSVLGNGSLTNFDNSGLPFGPGDITAGYQWPTVSLAPAASTSSAAVTAVNTTTGTVWSTSRTPTVARPPRARCSISRRGS
jgi:hypothetical protein